MPVILVMKARIFSDRRSVYSPGNSLMAHPLPRGHDPQQVVLVVGPLDERAAAVALRVAAEGRDVAE